MMVRGFVDVVDDPQDIIKLILMIKLPYGNEKK